MTEIQFIQDFSVISIAVKKIVTNNNRNIKKSKGYGGNLLIASGSSTYVSVNPKPVLCDYLEGWERGLRGRGHVYNVADSC